VSTLLATFIELPFRKLARADESRLRLNGRISRHYLGDAIIDYLYYQSPLVSD
jgi:hypothetical protein